VLLSDRALRVCLLAHLPLPSKHRIGLENRYATCRSSALRLSLSLCSALWQLRVRNETQSLQYFYNQRPTTKYQRPTIPPYHALEIACLIPSFLLLLC
jgi:hypothetical protein